MLWGLVWNAVKDLELLGRGFVLRTTGYPKLWNPSSGNLKFKNCKSNPASVEVAPAVLAHFVIAVCQVMTAIPALIGLITWIPAASLSRLAEGLFEILFTLHGLWGSLTGRNNCGFLRVIPAVEAAGDHSFIVRDWLR